MSVIDLSERPPTLTAEQVAAYGRQSHNKKISIASQFVVIDTDLHAEGLPAAGRHYSDGSSASRFAAKGRDMYPELIADIRSGEIKLLALWETSRADRDLTAWSTMLDLCRRMAVRIRVQTHGRTYDMRNARDWKSLAEDGVANQFEVEMLSQRVAPAMGVHAAAGKPHATAPYGYTREYDPRTRELIAQIPDAVERSVYARVTPHASEPWSPAGIAAAMFAAVHARRSLKRFVRALNDRGIPTPRQLVAIERGDADGIERWIDSRWTVRAIGNIVVNPAYIGHRLHNKRLVRENCWTPLVDEQTFWEIQSILAAREPVGHDLPTQARYLLTCIAECECGDKMVSQPLKPPRNSRYQCRNSDASVSLNDLDDLVIAKILDWLADGDNYADVLDDDTTAELAKLFVERARVTADLATWRQQLKDPSITIEMSSFGLRERALLDLLDDIVRRMREVDMPAALQQFVGDDPVAALARWDSFDLTARRAVVRELVTVTVRRVGKRSRIPIEERVDIAWRKPAA
jgi:DNA invertase Pin-like site-specific DNA recombinase